MVDFQEVQKHNQKNDCWVIIHNRVYDVTDFLPEHPGGPDIILKYAGKDATKAFDPIHPPDTLEKYLDKKYHLGECENRPKKKKSSAKSVESSTRLDTSPQDTSSGISNVVDEFDVEYDEQEDKEPLPFKVAHKEATEDEKTEEFEDEDDEPPTEEEIQRREMVKKMPDLSQIYNLNDFEFVAQKTMDKVSFAYYSSGSDDEITMRENHLAYHRIFFKPRIMVDVTNIDLSTTMLGTKTSCPFYITATALGKLGHPDGEKVLTRAAARQDVIQMVPTLASCSFDEIVDQATDTQTQWFQLYVNSNRETCKNIIQHAEKRGIKGLFITVDAPQLGRREKDMRLKDVQDLSFVQGEGEDADRSQGAARAISSFIDTSLNWKDIKWFRSVTKLPIILKGVQSVEDALLAVDHGVEGIVLSNHGGRQLEFAKPPVDVLAELMPILRERHLQDKIEVYVDGGIRRANDVLKAICLGAKGVGIGRPFLYAMSTYGDDGVFKAIQILKDEMVMNMRLLGATSIEQLNDKFVEFRKPAGAVSEDKLFRTSYVPLQPPAFKEHKL